MWRNKPKAKSKLGVEDLRALRRECEAVLRKARREEHLISKRLLRDLSEDEDQSLEEDIETNNLSEQQVAQWIRDIQCGSVQKLQAVISLRRKLQRKNVQLMFVRVEGSMRILIGLFTCPFADIQLEAARALHELSHSDDPAVSNACLPATSYLITYLAGYSSEFTEICLYTLGNLIVESEAARNQMIRQGLTSALSQCIKSPHMKVVEALGYVLSQLLQVKEAPAKIIPTILGLGLIRDILRLTSYSENGFGVAVEYAWCLHYIISSQVNNRLLISQGIGPKLAVFLVDLAKCTLQTECQGLELLICPIVRSLGNLLAEDSSLGNKVQIQDGRLLIALFVFIHQFQNDHMFLVRECLWTLNNLTVDDPAISSALLHLNLLPVLFQLLTYSKDVSLLVLLILCNITSLGPAYCKPLRQIDILPSVLRTFGGGDVEVIRQCLELLYILFKYCPEYLIDFHQLSGLKTLEPYKEQPFLHLQVQAIWNQCQAL